MTVMSTRRCRSIPLRLRALLFFALTSAVVGCGGGDYDAIDVDHGSADGGNGAAGVAQATTESFSDCYKKEISIKQSLTKILSSVRDPQSAQKVLPKIRALADELRQTTAALEGIVQSNAESPEQMAEAAKALSGKANFATAKMNDAWSVIRKDDSLVAALKPAMDEYRSAQIAFSQLRRTATQR